MTIIKLGKKTFLQLHQNATPEPKSCNRLLSRLFQRPPQFVLPFHADGMPPLSRKVSMSTVRSTGAAQSTQDFVSQ